MTARWRAQLFTTVFIGWSILCCLLMVPAFLLPRRAALKILKIFFFGVIPFEKIVLGLNYKVIGREHLPAAGRYIVAAKHQSIWETLKMPVLFKDPAIVYKRELARIPLWGWYMRKTGMIAIDRGGASKTLRNLVIRAQAALADGRPLIIFPQGTRVPVGMTAPYQVGIAQLYKELQVPVVPLALNAGLFWPRRGPKRGGTVTLEFLPPIPPGLKPREFLSQLEAQLESASNKLTF